MSTYTAILVLSTFVLWFQGHKLVTLKPDNNTLVLLGPCSAKTYFKIICQFLKSQIFVYRNFFLQLTQKLGWLF